MNLMYATGNLTEDAKVISHPAKGDQAERDQVVFTVAENKTKTVTEFVPVSVWGQKGFAEKVLPFLTRGKTVHVEGKKRNTEAKTGSNDVVYHGYVLAMDSLFGLKLLSGGQGGSQGAEPASAAPAADPAPAAQGAPDYDSFDDDIPF